MKRKSLSLLLLTSLLPVIPAKAGIQPALGRAGQGKKGIPLINWIPYQVRDDKCKINS